MTEGDSAALVVSIIALAVAVIAAGFTGWQAITAHLVRTRPSPAKWMIEFPSNGRWNLHNVGGSIATDVTIRLGFLTTKVGKPWRQFEVGQAVAPGASVPVPDTDRVPDPRVKMYPNPDRPNTRLPVKDGDSRADAEYVTDHFVTIHWRDYQGRTKRGRVPVR